MKYPNHFVLVIFQFIFFGFNTYAMDKTRAPSVLLNKDQASSELSLRLTFTQNKALLNHFILLGACDELSNEIFPLINQNNLSKVLDCKTLQELKDFIERFLNDQLKPCCEIADHMTELAHEILSQEYKSFDSAIYLRHF